MRSSRLILTLVLALIAILYVQAQEGGSSSNSGNTYKYAPDVFVNVDAVATSKPVSDGLLRIEHQFSDSHNRVMSRLNRVLKRVETYGHNNFAQPRDEPVMPNIMLEESSNTNDIDDQALLAELEGKPVESTENLLSLHDLSSDSLALLESSAKENQEAKELLDESNSFNIGLIETASHEDNCPTCKNGNQKQDHEVVLSNNSPPNPLETPLLKEKHDKINYLLKGNNIVTKESVLVNARDAAKDAHDAHERFQDFAASQADAKLIPDQSFVESEADADAEAEADAEVDVDLDTDAELDAESESEALAEGEAEAQQEVDAEAELNQHALENAAAEMEMEVDTDAVERADAENTLDELHHEFPAEFGDDLGLMEVSEHELSNQGRRGNYPGWSTSLLEEQSQNAPGTVTLTASPAHPSNKIIPKEGTPGVTHITLNGPHANHVLREAGTGIKKLHVHMYGKSDTNIDRTRRLHGMVRRLAHNQNAAVVKINELISQLKKCAAGGKSQECLPKITDKLEDWKADNLGESM